MRRNPPSSVAPSFARCTCIACNKTFLFLPSLSYSKKYKSRSGRLFCSLKCAESHVRKIRRKKLQVPIENKILKTECVMCGTTENLSEHHIIPRAIGGEDNAENKITLCNICHDYVELKTEDWIKSGKRYDIEVLRSMIVNLGF